LTVGTSPLFLFLAASYMTDVPGMFALVLCLYMCQRAVVAATDRTLMAWLISAALVNLASGTVRQTSWLGALVMVPSTAWLLRKHRNVLAVAVALLAFTLAGIFAFMHWAGHQPFFVPEPFLIDPTVYRGAWYLLGEFAKTILCLLLVLFPIMAGWLINTRRLDRAAWMRILVGTAAFTLMLALRARHGMLWNWVMPWLVPVLMTVGMSDPDPVLGGAATIPLHGRAAISVLVVAAGFVVLEQVIRKLKEPKSAAPRNTSSLQVALTLTVPFILAYLLLLVPRAATSLIQDRYLLGIIPSLIILLLLSYERWFYPQLPVLSAVILAIFAVYGIGSNHNLYSYLRTQELAVQTLRSAGVPRTSIVEGFGPDGWVQVDVAGYVNSSNMVMASRYYDPHVPMWDLPTGCVSYLPQTVEPVIHPRYFITGSQTSCLAPTVFSPLSYIAWLPPFHRQVIIQQLQHSAP
jgi:hypothetical protein